MKEGNFWAEWNYNSCNLYATYSPVFWPWRQEKKKEFNTLHKLCIGELIRAFVILNGLRLISLI